MAITLVVLGFVAIAASIVLFVRRVRLIATMLLAAGVLSVVSGWLLPVASRADALRTGGLAAASVVALYALWLNDRRRQVDEQRQLLDHERQALDHERAAHERERAADDRFLRGVELLGHEMDQVRVGALHALAGLARAYPSYTQDVLDVICSYLRRPFAHPDYDDKVELHADADRWREVRMTAQRLVADLLPKVGDEDAPAYNLDLTGATLEYLDLSYRVIGELRARALKLHSSNSFHHSEIRGNAWFTASVNDGNLWMHHMVFHKLCWFRRFTARSIVDFNSTVFHGSTSFADSVYDATANFADTTFAEEPDFSNTEFNSAVTMPPDRS